MTDFAIGTVSTRSVDRTDTLRERVALRMGGLEWSAWGEVGITLGLKRPCRSASLALAAIDPRAQRLLDIEPEMTCEVRIGNEAVLTGSTDSDDYDDAEGSRFSVGARSLTKDLVDCSVDHPTGVFRGQKVEAIAAALCKPYSIQVICDADTGAALPLFRATDKETVIQALDRMGRERGLLYVDDGEGRLHIVQITEPGSPVRTLKRGRDYANMTRRRTSAERHSEIRVHGQTATEIDAAGNSRDAWMTRKGRHRLLVIDSEKAASSAECKRRAAFEMAVRAGRSVQFTVMVPGWRTDPTDPESPLWKPNWTIRLDDNRWAIDDDLLIGEVAFRRGAGQKTATALTVGPASGFMVQPPKHEKGGKKSKALMGWFDDDEGDSEE